MHSQFLTDDTGRSCVSRFAPIGMDFAITHLAQTLSQLNFLKGQIPTARQAFEVFFQSYDLAVW